MYFRREQINKQTQWLCTVYSFHSHLLLDVRHKILTKKCCDDPGFSKHEIQSKQSSYMEMDVVEHHGPVHLPGGSGSCDVSFLFLVVATTHCYRLLKQSTKAVWCDVMGSSDGEAMGGEPLNELHEGHWRIPTLVSVVPRLTKIIRSGITFVSWNVISP